MFHTSVNVYEKKTAFFLSRLVGWFHVADELQEHKGRHLSKSQAFLEVSQPRIGQGTLASCVAVWKFFSSWVIKNIS